MAAQHSTLRPEAVEQLDYVLCHRFSARVIIPRAGSMIAQVSKHNRTRCVELARERVEVGARAKEAVQHHQRSRVERGMLRWDHSAVQVNVAPKDEESPRHAKGQRV